jgi:hypothetical protein
MLRSLKISRRLIALILFFGFFVGFGSGLVENPDASNYPVTYAYGFPLAWRSVNTASGDKNAYPLELFIDVLFGMAIVSVIAVSYALTQRWVSKKTPKPTKDPRQRHNSSARRNNSRFIMLVYSASAC